MEIDGKRSNASRPLTKCVIPFSLFKPEWAVFFGIPAGSIYYLPTEVVVTSPQFVVPRKIGLWGTDLFLVHGEIVDNYEYSDMRKKTGLSWDADHQLAMCEVYDDHGDDGHVYYRLMGYRFVTMPDLQVMSDQHGSKLPAAFFLHYNETLDGNG